MQSLYPPLWKVIVSALQNQTQNCILELICFCQPYSIDCSGRMSQPSDLQVHAEVPEIQKKTLEVFVWDGNGGADVECGIQLKKLGF